jgi:hypothetical protein
MNSICFERPSFRGYVPSWDMRFLSSVWSSDRILGPTQSSIPKRSKSIVFYKFVLIFFDLVNNFSVKYMIKYHCIPNLAVQWLALCIWKPPSLNLGSVTGYPEVFCSFRQLLVQNTEMEPHIRPRPCPFISSYIRYTP